MSPVALLAIALLLLVIPGFGRRASRRMKPQAWVRLALAAIAGGLVLLEAGLVLASAPTVMCSVGLAGLADLCQRVAGHLAPGGAPVAWAAAGAALAIPSP